MATLNSWIRRLRSTATARASALLPLSRRHRHASLAEQHRLHFDLLCKAMDDPALAAVLDTYETDVPPETQRQYLFATALYINALHFHRIGALSKAELYGHLRVMCRNRIFQEYWESTRHHRQSLAAASEEAELGRMMDDLIRDLTDADTEEWWVVGEPPDESA